MRSVARHGSGDLSRLAGGCDARATATPHTPKSTVIEHGVANVWLAMEIQVGDGSPTMVTPLHCDAEAPADAQDPVVLVHRRNNQMARR